MRRIVSLAVLAGLVGILGYLYLVRGVKVGKPPSPLESRYKTEEHWLVDQIVRDIAETAAFCQARHAARATATQVEIETNPEGVARVRVQVVSAPELRDTITIRDFVWSPQDYAPFAASILQALHVTPEPTSDQSQVAFLGRLLDVRGEVLEGESRVLSDELGTRPADPRLHEEAALVLGVLALRESAGDFADTRFALCRMAAHLALARALRGNGPASMAGRHAEVVLLMGAGRGANAEALLSELEQEAAGRPVLAAWNRALRMRNTHDWRLRQKNAAETLMESLEGMRAERLALRRKGWEAEDLPQAAGQAPDVAWAVLQWPSVEDANLFTDPALDLTLGESRRVLELTHQRAPGGSETIALNVPAQRLMTPEGPRVLGWGSWAAFYQRHVCFLLQLTDHHYRHMLGLKSEADAAGSKADALFGGLELYPLVRARRDVEAGVPFKHLDEAVTLTIQRPELVTFPEWHGAETATSDEVIRRGLPAGKAWFATGCPRGTVYDIAHRGPGPGVVATATNLRPLREMAPRDVSVAGLMLRTYGDRGHPDDYTRVKPEDVVRELGPLLDYDLWAIEAWQAAAKGKDPAGYRKAAERRCELNADECWSLGLMLAYAGEEAAAVAVYDKAIDQVRDRVAVSNRCAWVVGYHLRHGNKERARQIAEMAAEVGSGNGLTTMSKYLEMTGDYAGAEDYLRQEEERYPGEGGPRYDRLTFYWRMAHVNGVAAYDVKFRAEAKDVFPAGVETIQMATLKGQPTDGVMIVKPGERFRERGLRGGEIIVGVRGYRTRTEEQLRSALLFSLEPGVTYLIWQHPAYRELQLPSPNPWPPGTEIRTYSPGR